MYGFSITKIINCHGNAENKHGMSYKLIFQYYKNPWEELPMLVVCYHQYKSLQNVFATSGQFTDKQFRF
jgi:hypothetical protein